MNSTDKFAKTDIIRQREAQRKEIAQAVCNLLKEKYPDVSVLMAKRALAEAAIELESITLLG